MIFNLFILYIFAALPLEENLADKIKNEKSKYIKTEQQVRSYLSDLYSIQNRLKKISDKIEKLEKNKNQHVLKIRDMSKEIQTLEKEIAENQKILNLRIRLAAQILDTSLQEIIVFSKSPSEIERTLKGLEAVMEKDIGHIKNIETDKEKQFLARNDLRQEMTKYGANKEALELSIADLKNNQMQRQKIVSKLKKDKDKHMQALKILREQGEDMVLLSSDLSKNLAEQILARSFFEFKGNLMRPLDGKIIYGFGERHEEKLKFLSKGVWLSGAYRQEIQSVAKGKVVFLGKIDKAFNAIVVEHDNNYYSVYAPITNAKVNEGDWIEFKQPIASLARQSTKGRSALYFELRHYSEPLNPEQWFLKEKTSLTRSEGEQREVY